MVRSVQRVHLGPGLRHGRTGPEPADVHPTVVVPRVVRALLRREGQRRPHPNVGIDKKEAPRHDADNREGAGAEAYHPTHDAGVASVGLLPQTVAQDDLLVLAWLTLGLGEDPSEEGRNPQQAKERRRRGDADDALGRSVEIECAAALEVEQRLFFEGGHARQAIVVVGHAAVGRLGGSRMRILISHHEDGVRVGDRERLQQHGIHDAEHRGVCAYADREGEDGRGGKAPVLPEQPSGQREVAAQEIHVRRRAIADGLYVSLSGKVRRARTRADFFRHGPAPSEGCTR